jgi:hypothetical protein
MLQAGVFAVLFMIELKNLTNVVIGKLGKLVHKQKCSRDFFLFKKIIASLLYKLDALPLKQKNIHVLVLDITDFLICFNSIKVRLTILKQD